MVYFGDASGHLRGVLNGDCEVYVAAVVGGDKIRCGKCAKQAVRRIDDLPEAKWNSLKQTPKRRLVDCLADHQSISLGVAQFTREKLQSLNNYHLLYQDISFPPDWDLALEGYAYGEILYEMNAKDDQRPVFEFDRVSSKEQSVAVRDHVEKFVPETNIFFQGSRQSNGIQTADCLAGAVAEDFKSNTEWLSRIDDDRIVECSNFSLIQLEQRLSEHSTAP